MSPLATKIKPVRRRSVLLRETRTEAKLRCGLQACVVPRPGFRRKAAAIIARYGSVDLSFAPTGGEKVETPAGIAHFLEHQLFKKEDGSDLLMEFGRFGASANAYTDYTGTAYYFSGGEGFDPSLDLLLELAFSPSFQPERVAKEREIIEQELRMYENLPDARGYRALLEGLYREHPVRLDIGGTVKSISEIDAGLLSSCYRAFYHPSNMTLVIAGDFDPGKMLRRLDEALDPARFSGGGVTSRSLPEEPPEVAQERSELQMLVSRPRLLLGGKGPAGGDVMQRELETAAILQLLFGRSSSFHRRAYERGWIDDSFSASCSVERPFSFYSAGGETDLPDVLEREIRKVLNGAGERRFSRREVDRMRRKLSGRYLQAYDSPVSAGFLVMGCLVRDEDPYAIPNRIRKITPQSLQRRCREMICPDHLSVSLVLPKTPPRS